MESHEQLLEEMSEHNELFQRIAKEIPEPQLSTRPGEDKWSVKEILCHLADIQTVGAGRIHKMLGEDNPPIELYYEERENIERDHRGDDMREWAEKFAADRSSL